VTTRVAAEALGVDPRTIRTYIRRGDLKAKSEGEGVEKAYSVDIDSVYALRDARKASGKVRERNREKSADAEDFGGLIRDLTSQLVSASTEAADLRARLELTAQAESTLREERDRLLGETDRLRAELEAARRPWWRRVFGG